MSRVFRVNQVFFSLWGPPFLHKLQTLRPTHSRSQMHNILRARFRFTYSPLNAARNARTQRRKQMPSVKEQKIHAMLSRERLITFLICLFYICIYIYTPSNQHLKAFPVSKINSETSFLYQLFEENSNFIVLKPCKGIYKSIFWFSLLFIFIRIFIYAFIHLHIHILMPSQCRNSVPRQVSVSTFQGEFKYHCFHAS